MKCPTCSAEHLMPLSPRTGEPDFTTCLKVINARVTAIESLIAGPDVPADKVAAAEKQAKEKATAVEEVAKGPPEVIALGPAAVEPAGD